MNLIESVCICSKSIQIVSLKNEINGAATQVYFYATIVGYKSLAKNFSQHVSPLLYNIFPFIETQALMYKPPKEMTYLREQTCYRLD